jgi:hypothetical protein
MWKPDGPLVAPDSLGSLEPVDVLFEYDCEPLTFVVHDPGGHLLLAHWLDFSDGTTRYLISAIDSQILNDLRSNRLDLQGALRQPRCWIADLRAQSWTIAALWHVNFESVPKEDLPEPGAMLNP